MNRVRAKIKIVFSVLGAGLFMGMASSVFADIGVAGLKSGELFLPSIHDQSLVFLRSLFGPIGPLLGGDGNISGILFRWINIGFLFLVLGLAGVTVFQSALMAATEGTAIKNKIRSLTAIRMVVSILLMAPWPSGYSSMQTGMMWVTYYGVGLADQIWHHAIDTVKDSKGVFMSAHGGKKDSTHINLKKLVIFTPQAAENAQVTPADFYKSSVCTRTVFRKSQEFRDGLSDQAQLSRIFGNPNQYRVRISEKVGDNIIQDGCKIKNGDHSDLENIGDDFTALCFGGPDDRTEVAAAHYDPGACGIYVVKSTGLSKKEYLAAKNGMISSAYVLSTAGHVDFDNIYFKYKNEPSTTEGDLSSLRRYCKSEANLTKITKPGKLTNTEIERIHNMPSACLGGTNLVAAATNFFMATKNARMVEDPSNKYEDEEILDTADNLGWMTAGIYYGKLSAQGQGFSSVSKVKYSDNLDKFKPTIYKLWQKGTDLYQNYPNNIGKDSPVFKAYNYFSNNVYNEYQLKAKEMLVNIAEASTMDSMLNEDVDNKGAGSTNTSSDRVFGNIASYFTTKVLINPIGVKRFCMGNSIAVPISTTIGASAVASMIAPQVALPIVVAAGAVFLYTSCTGILGVKVDIAYRNMIKSLNLVIRELLGVNIYSKGTSLGNYSSYDINKDLNKKCYRSISKDCMWSRSNTVKLNADTAISQSLQSLGVGGGEANDIGGTIGDALHDPILGAAGAGMVGSINNVKKTKAEICLQRLENTSNDCIENGKGVLGQFIANKKGYMVDPFSSLQKLGQTMIIAAVSYWQYTYQESWTTYKTIHGVVAGSGVIVNAVATAQIVTAGSTAKSFRVLVAVTASVLTSAMKMLLELDIYQLELFKTMGGAVASIMFATGTTLAILIPMLPMVMYLMAGLGWLFLVVEGMIAAPLIVLGLAHPTSHDYLGKSQQAFLIYFSIFLRPSLILIGYMFGMMLSYVAIRYLNYGFLWFASSYVLGFDPTIGSDESTKYLVELIFLIAIIAVYIYVMMIVLMHCFSYIHKLPDQVSRWIDSSYQPVAGGGIDAAISGIDSSVARGSSGVASGATETSSQRPNLAQTTQQIIGAASHGVYEQGRDRLQQRKENIAKSTPEGQKLLADKEAGTITKETYNRELKAMADDMKGWDSSKKTRKAYFTRQKQEIQKDLSTISNLGRGVVLAPRAFGALTLAPRNIVRGLYNAVRNPRAAAMGAATMVVRGVRSGVRSVGSGAISMANSVITRAQNRFVNQNNQTDLTRLRNWWRGGR